MDDTTLKISLAALMHDMGKFTDQVVLSVTDEYLNNNSQLYCPFNKEQNRHTHTHAVFTAAFIEEYKDWLPPQFNEGGWGEGDAFVNLAAGHHNPSTPLQWIVAMADRISSGFDRHSFNDYNQRIPWKDYRKTRLIPLFEQIRLPSNVEHQKYEPQFRYPLKRVSPVNIFPSIINTYETLEEQAKHEYTVLFDFFREDLKKLDHRLENIELWGEHFESLLMIYTSAIPSARAGDVVPDVSLYDHAKSTAALAAAMYLYHLDTDSLSTTAVQDYDADKFLLIGGDFYGIQDFIFSTHGDIRKYRSKLLRGRSFTVSLLTELAADLICRKIGIPLTSVALNAAGKFTIIAPNTPAAKHAVNEARQEINNWLVNISYGQNAIGLSTIKASPEDFVNGKFLDLWEKLQSRMSNRKLSRIDLENHGGVFSDYLNKFRNDLPQPLCPLCGKRASSPESGNSRYIRDDDTNFFCCDICRDQVFLGTNLVKKKRIVILDKNTAQNLKYDDCLYEPIYNNYQLIFSEDNESLDFNSSHIIHHWSLSYILEKETRSNIAIKFINGYVPVFSEYDKTDSRFNKMEEPIRIDDPKTFGHLAATAKSMGDDKTVLGISALGVLKADVDNLGMVMACGLTEQTFTLSRLSTLSRQLNYFFSVYLPYLLEKEPDFNNIYTVFAGGDDLFLIGPWNRIIDLVARLKDQFKNYVCGNNEIHFSAGISLHKANTPIDAMAHAAEEALEASKEGEKNKLTLFSCTISLDQVDSMEEVKNTLTDWLNKKHINKAMLYKLNELIHLAGEEKRLVKCDSSIRVEDMSCTRWRALLAYSTERNIGKELTMEKRSVVVKEVREKLAYWIEQYGASFRIPLWRVLYEIRR